MADLKSSLHSIQDEALTTLRNVLRLPSVSSDSEKRQALQACGEALEALLQEWEFTTKWIDVEGYPCLVAEAGPERGPTVLIYGHYDVQPALPEDGWTTDPFEPVVRNGAIVCRGASDDKGQVVAMLYGLEAYRRAYGKFPCRVRVLLEGAEEIGSPGFEEALQRNRALVEADFAVVGDCGRIVPERPGLICGLRGLAYLELTVQGPRADLHSGTFGGTVDNPAQVLCGMLAALKDARRKVAVPGFYDDVVPPTEDELKQLEAVPFDEETYRRSLGVQRLAGEEGYSTLVRRWLRPALDINGLRAGHTGEGAKTVLPATATAKVSVRTVVNQDPDKILSLLEDFFRSLLPETCTISFKRYASAKPVKLDLSGRQAAWVLEALRRAYGAEPLRVFEGATIPVVSTFAEMGITPFPIGFGRIDDGAHGPDERFYLDDFTKAISTTAHLLEVIAEEQT